MIKETGKIIADALLGKVSRQGYNSIVESFGVIDTAWKQISKQQTAVTVRGVTLTSSDIDMYYLGKHTISIQSDGDSFWGSDLTSAATTSLCIFSNAQTYNSESLGAGDVLFGDNSTSKANILWDASAGQIKFRGGTTTQAYIDTTGAITAGAGAVVLGSSGIKLISSTSYSTTNSLLYYYGTSIVAKIYAYYYDDAPLPSDVLYGNIDYGNDALDARTSLTISVSSKATWEASLYLTASSVGSGNRGFHIYADSDATPAYYTTLNTEFRISTGLHVGDITTTASTTGRITATEIIQSYQASAAKISLDHNSATGNFTLSLSPANLTASHRVTFPDYDMTFPAADAAGYLYSNGAGVLSWAALTITHAMLSTTHTDSTASAVARGSIITGQGVTPSWTQLVKGTAGAVLTGDGTDVAWSTYYLSGTATKTYTFPIITDTLAGLGTANTFTADQTINRNTATALTVWNGGARALVVDVLNTRVGIGRAPTSTFDCTKALVGTGGTTYGSNFLFTVTGSGSVVSNAFGTNVTLTSCASLQALQNTITIVSSDATNVAVTNAYGNYVLAQFSGSSTGNVSCTSLSCYYVAAPGVTDTGGGTLAVTNMYGLNILNLGFSQCTNSYGIYIAAQSGSATINRAIHTAGGDHYFGGATTITGILSVDHIAEVTGAHTVTIDDNVTIGIAEVNTDYSITVNGEHSDGVVTWMEDDDYFQFADDINMGGATNFVKINDTDGGITWGGTYLKKLTLRPNLVEKTTKTGGIPDQVYRGVNVGYSLPVWSGAGSSNEELYWRMRIPQRWDGATDPQFGMCVTLAGSSEDVGDHFKFSLEWQTTNKGNVMGTTLDTTYTEQVLLTGRADAYDTYFVFFTLDASSTTNPISTGEMLQARVRRVDATDPDITGEVIVWDWASMWPVDKVYTAWSVETNDT